jgi:hypothetical protein
MKTVDHCCAPVVWLSDASTEVYHSSQFADQAVLTGFKGLAGAGMGFASRRGRTGCGKKTSFEQKSTKSMPQGLKPTLILLTLCQG